MAGKENPLTVHGIVLIGVGLAVVAAGVVGIVRAASGGDEAAATADEATGAEGHDGQNVEASTEAKPVAPAKSGGATNPMKTVQKTQREIAQTKGDLTTLKSAATKPTLSGGMAALRSGARLKGKLPGMGGVVPFLLPVATILVGIATGLMGFFVFQRKNWARYVGFALLAVTVLYFVFVMSGPGGLGNRHNSMAFPIIAMAIVTPLAAKFLWDLWVEKIEPA